MIAVVQRVLRASVECGGEVRGSIGPGALVLLGVQKGDTAADAEYMSRKVAGLRMFDDAQGRMNLSAAEAGGSVLAVSQFTLAADCRKGKRPSFDSAAPSDEAEPLYEAFVAGIRSAGLSVETGVFGAAMDVELTNHGPVTFVISSRGAFGEEPQP